MVDTVWLLLGFCVIVYGGCEALLNASRLDPLFRSVSRGQAPVLM